MCNQPSISGVRAAGTAGERFQQIYFSTAAWHARRHPSEGTLKRRAEWSTEDEGTGRLLRITASAPPQGLRLGEEALLWYGDAGWGASSAEERDAGEAAFFAQYGFSPWR